MREGTMQVIVRIAYHPRGETGTSSVALGLLFHTPTYLIENWRTWPPVGVDEIWLEYTT